MQTWAGVVTAFLQVSAFADGTDERVCARDHHIAHLLLLTG